jgi:hypothetical protein
MMRPAPKIAKQRHEMISSTVEKFSFGVCFTVRVGRSTIENGISNANQGLGKCCSA